MTLKDLQRLKEQGLIRGYLEPSGEGLDKRAGSPGEKAGKGSPAASGNKKGAKIKGWIGLQLWYWCEVNGLELKTEFLFHPERKWRFDWAVPEIKVAFEYNGIMSAKSRHTTVGGYSGDMEKLNAAQALGWRVWQYTPLNHKNLLQDLNKLIENGK